MFVCFFVGYITEIHFNLSRLPQIAKKVRISIGVAEKRAQTFCLSDLNSLFTVYEMTLDNECL